MAYARDEILAMPTTSKTKSIAEVKGKVVKDKKTKPKKPKLAIETLRRVYRIVIDDPLPDYDDEAVERKKLLAAIKKVLR